MLLDTFKSTFKDLKEIPKTPFELFLNSPMGEDVTLEEETYLRKYPQKNAEGYARALHWLRLQQ